jgi:hypothetical protein
MLNASLRSSVNSVKHLPDALSAEMLHSVQHDASVEFVPSLASFLPEEERREVL